MDTQVEYLHKILKEVTPEGETVKLVYVDWASEEQHEGNGTPLRDMVTDPVLQSPWADDEGSFQDHWCDGKVEQCDITMFALDKSGCIMGKFNWFPDPKKNPVSLKDEDQYKKARRLVRLAIAGSLKSKKSLR